MANTRIVYIHGDQVVNWRWGWVARLKEALTDLGYDTFFELFPDSVEARAKYWLPFLRDCVRAGENDVLLGWSCGILAAMRYAEETPVKGLVLVAPYFSGDVGDRGWVGAPWRWEDIKRHAESVAVFHSDADPYIPQREFDELVAALDAQRERIAGARHFADQDVFPELLAYFQLRAESWVK